MGQPSVDQCLRWAEEARATEMQELDALRTALEACLPFAKRAVDNSRDVDKFKAARSAYRLGAAALGIEHE